MLPGRTRRCPSPRRANPRRPSPAFRDRMRGFLGNLACTFMTPTSCSAGIFLWTPANHLAIVAQYTSLQATASLSFASTSSPPIQLPHLEPPDPGYLDSALRLNEFPTHLHVSPPLRARSFGRRRQMNLQRRCAISRITVCTFFFAVHPLLRPKTPARVPYSCCLASGIQSQNTTLQQA